jgi:hypothetical protein
LKKGKNEHQACGRHQITAAKKNTAAAEDRQKTEKRKQGRTLFLSPPDELHYFSNLSSNLSLSYLIDIYIIHYIY